MGNFSAILGAALLLIGIIVVAIFGGSRSLAGARLIGIVLAVAGLGIEVVGAITT